MVHIFKLLTVLLHHHNKSGQNEQWTETGTSVFTVPAVNIFNH